VTIIDYGAFYGCSSLSNVTIPNSVISIGSVAFYGCTTLTDAYFLGDAPTGYANMFQGCATGFMVHYVNGMTGWTDNPWYGYPTVGSDIVTYAVTLGTIVAVGGDTTSTVAIDATPVAAGTTVTLTVLPATGMQLVPGTLVATDTNGGVATLLGTGPYTFTMPAYAVAVTATFEAKIVTHYGIWVGGIEVTSDNAANITGDGITGDPYAVSYASGTLTLNGAAITGYHDDGTSYHNCAGIYATNGLTITLLGISTINVTLPGQGAGIMSTTAGVALNGTGSLTITLKGTSAKWSMGIWAITCAISDCTVTVTGGATTGNWDANSIGIFTQNGDLSIANATVTANGGTSSGMVDGSYGIYARLGGIVVTNSTVTATGDTRAVFVSGLVTLNGSSIMAGASTGGTGAVPVTVDQLKAGDYKYVQIQPTYTVTFDSQGGSTVAAITGITSGTTVTLPAAATKAGYTLNGWFTAITGGTAFTADTTVTASLTVYAQWKPASSAAEILTYSLPGETGSATTSGTGTIAVTVPNATVVTGLVATFTASPAIQSIKVSAVAQVSATTSNNFTNAVTYTVTAEDGITTKNWVVTVTVANADQAAPTETLTGVAPTSYGLSDGKITGTTALMQYQLQGAGSYTTASATATTGLAAGTYNVRYAAKTGYNAGTDAAVVVAAGPNASQAAPTETLTGVAPTSYGLSDGKITGTTTAMEYKLSTASTYTPATASPTTVGAAGTYNVRYAAKTGYNAGTDAAVVVAAGPNASQATPTGLAGVAPTTFGGTDGKITGTTALMEYQLQGAGSYTTASATATTGLAAGTYNVRYAAKTGYNAGTDAAVVVAAGPNADQAAPTGLAGVAPTSALTDGKITGTTALMEYQLATDGTYAACSDTNTTVAAAGNYVVRLAAKTGYNAGATTAVTVPTYTAPTTTTYTVTFDTQGGLEAIDPETGIVSGAFAIFPPNPTKDGFTFAGWFTAITGGTAFTAATAVTADVTVYAQWTVRYISAPAPTPAAPPLTVVRPITSAHVAVTQGSIDFLFSFWSGSTPITFLQAQADLYCLDPIYSTVQLRAGSNDSSPVSSKVKLSDLPISNVGKLSYATFASMVAAFGGNFPNIPTDIRLILSCGVDPTISNPWTYDTGWIHFSPEEENVFALYAASAPQKNQTVLILQIGKTMFWNNSIPTKLDSAPVIKNSRTLLPIRAIIEALGGTVAWDPIAHKVTVKLGTKTVVLWIGKSLATVNGVSTPIDATDAKVVPEIINSRTMLPLRFVAENLGCTVLWAAATQTITITYTP